MGRPERFFASSRVEDRGSLERVGVPVDVEAEKGFYEQVV